MRLEPSTYFCLFLMRLLSHNDATEMRSCAAGMFHCTEEISGNQPGEPSRWCISKEWVCDGDKDCPDGSDERHNCPPPTCPPGSFQCKSHKVCIPAGWHCDGEDDCSDGSDEKECEIPGPACLPNTYECPGHHLCISFEQVCDGFYDCENHEDEGPHCRYYNCENTTCGEKGLCRETQEGAACYCQKGYFRNATESMCKDLDECSYDGYCDQLCSNTAGGYSCSCVDGYSLHDKTTCLAHNTGFDARGAILLFTNGTMISQVYLNDSNVIPDRSVNASSKNIVIDYHNKSVCYIKMTDPQLAEFECFKVDDVSKTWKISIAYKLNGLQHIAFDWLSQNWYFADEPHSRIFVCNYIGTVCVTVVGVDLIAPRSIALDPNRGVMFFAAYANTAKIESALLDGTNRQDLVRERRLVRPQALTLDYAKQHVYWTDSYLQMIERVNYDGSQRRRIASFQVNVFALALHENFLYVASHRSGSIMRLHRLNKEYSEPRSLLSGIQTPTAIQIFHSVRQPDPDQLAEKPCSKMKCEHLCITLYSQSKYYARCFCKSGWKVVKETKCVRASDTKFLLYSNAKLGAVKSLPIPPKKMDYEPMIPITGLRRPFALDYDVQNQYIYYSDTDQFRIGRRKVDGSNHNDSFISQDITDVEGLAIDWIGKNIFWTDEGDKTINVALIADPNVRTILVKDSIAHPRAIAVDPVHGYMYWTDWAQLPSHNATAKIERAYMNGEKRTVLVDTDILWPNGLSLDHGNQILYFCDAYTNFIERIILTDPSFPRKKFQPGELQLTHSYGLAHWYPNIPEGSKPEDNVHFFWTEESDGHIKYWNQKNTTILLNQSASLFGIKLFDNSAQTETGACSQNGNCSHLCLAIPGGRVCACPAGMNLSDEKTCEDATGNYTMNTGCSENEFKCKNGRCINDRWKCDGDNDCGDNSDEAGGQDGEPCYDFSCPEKNVMYKCRNNRCIYNRWLCDGEDDCRNGEDELTENCNSSNCTANMTRCTSSLRCIPDSWLCDYDNDCGDGSDEHNCSYETCRPDQFTCKNHRCISRLYVCDGDNDCRDRSDEDNCGNLSCTNATHFKCASGTRCLKRVFLCDGDPNCEDKSDEQNCTAMAGIDCAESDFRCDNGFCIHLTLRCDFDDDCGDNSDENACNNTATFKCDANDWQCPNQTRCIPSAWRCDGDQDCENGTDETNCFAAPTVDCNYPSKLCSNNITCVNVTQLCDNVTDCPNGEDEKNFCDFDMCRHHDCSHECSKSPDGYVCVCPPGKKPDPNDHTQCVHSDPCQQWGICSQHCFYNASTYYHYKCSCSDGYVLAPDQFTCKPDDNLLTYIIFSNRHEIRRLDVEGKSYVSLVSGLRNTIALDFWYNHTSEKGDSSLVFWTDVVDDKIYRGTMISNSVTNIQVVVNVGLATAEGLAVDWITEHLYWVESNLDQIEVANFNGSLRHTLIAGNMESPRAIAVDPLRGLLFWTDWDSNQPRIERAPMCGDSFLDSKNRKPIEERRVIFNVSDVLGAGWPNGLTLDIEAQRVYWIDARSDSIHTCDYDGKNLREVLHGIAYLSHPFAISLFGNYVYWTDWRTNSIVRANKWNGTDLQVIQQIVTQPFDLHIFHPKRQPLVFNPCANGGGCKSPAICLLGANRGSVCRCPHRYKLDKNDKTRCKLDEEFLLYAKKQEIRGVDLENANYSVIPALTVPFVYNPLAIDFFIDNNQIYWTDDDSNHGQSGINRANLNGTNIETIIDSGIHNPSGFAIDWISKNMYFSSYDSNEASISVARLNGAFRTILLQNDATANVTLQKPNSIAVHPTNGKIFWSDLNDESNIYVANLDGSEPRRLALQYNTQVEVKGPTSLTVELKKNRLWWVNTKSNRNTIVFCNLDDSTLQALPTNNVTNSVTAITVNDDKVYMAHGGSTNTISVMEQSTSKMELMRANTPRIRALRIFAKRETSDNPCSTNNGGCSQLCLPINRIDKVCRCTSGFKLIDNNKCEGFTDFLMYSNVTEIVGISLDPSENTTRALAPISGIAAASALDFDAAEDFIYWVDADARKILRIKRDLTERETLVDSGIVGVEGLALDWMAGNMYWTDQSLGVIQVARLNGSYRRVVVYGNMNRPKSIVVHPEKGYMIWADIDNPKIEMALLDGSKRRVIREGSNNIQYPSALTIDYEQNVLYWCDKNLDKIEKIYLNTTHPEEMVYETVVSKNLTDCMGITVLKDYLYWLDVSYTFGVDGVLTRTEKQGSISRVKKKDGSDKTLMRKNLGSRVMDLKVFHKERQSGTNDCTNGNAGCEELCLYTGNVDGARCLCAHGLLENKKCKDHATFLAYSTVKHIETVLMEQTEGDPSQIPNADIKHEVHMKNVIGLTVDYASKRYFYSDIQIGSIQSVDFKGEHRITIIENVGSAEGLAYDAEHKLLYWTSYTDSSISRMLLSSSHFKPTPQKLVQLSAEDHPRAIVLDGCQHMMFWTNWNDRQASIQSASQFGYNVSSIIKTDIKTPNGLTIDHTLQRLFWSDAGLDKIERCKFDGSERRVLLSNNPRHPFGLCVYGDFLYWTDWSLRAILRVNKFTGGDITYIKKNLSRHPMAIVVIAKDSDNCRNNLCLWRGESCEQHCDPNPDTNTTYCYCDQDLVLQPDNITCGPPAKECLPTEFMCIQNGVCIPFELTCDGTYHCQDESDEDFNYCNYRTCPVDYMMCSNKRCIRQIKRCDRVNDCGDGSDEAYCRHACEKNQFQCVSDGSCILEQYRCDHDKDCPDASDEMGCNSTDCSYFGQTNLGSSKMIKCPNTTVCILPHWRCDQHNDCWDNSDEENCNNTVTNSPCNSEDWFQCKNKECVPKLWQCDGDPDCKDGSDEDNCKYNCPQNQKACGNTSMCIPEAWWCDGHHDCTNKADEGEEDCAHKNKTCTGDHFQCNNGNCIPSSWVCDRETDCAEGEDEGVHSGCEPVTCEDGFQCSDNTCIRKSFFCDGDYDCEDRSDEPGDCANRSCAEYMFTCREIHQCVDVRKVCDGIPDCHDNSDESTETCIPKFIPCGSRDMFLCNNGACVNETLLCNQYDDCGDYSDEISCDIDECDEMPIPCDHKCINKPIGFECQCFLGYQLAENNRSCHDVNECNTTYPCSQYCVNSPGSYKCYCDSRFMLQKENGSCKAYGNVPKPILLVTNRYYIRNVSMTAKEMSVVKMDLSNAVGLDFDWQERKIYWSDVTSTSNKISSMNEDGSNATVLHSSTLRNPDGVAVDWLGRNLYWCDKTTDTIEVSKLNGSYRKVLVKAGLQEPRAIVLHPLKGWLFYSDWGISSHIGRLGMDGSQRTLLVTDHLGWPNALTIDYISGHLFWGDARLDYIAMTDLDGNGRRYVITDKLPHVFALTVYEDYLYWSDWETKSIQRAHKFSGNQRQTLAEFIHRPMDIQVYHPYRQLAALKVNQKNPCENNGGCFEGALCLIKPGGSDHICACPERHYLSTDKKSCIANCTSSEFLCKATYKCIPFWWKCDGQDDCGDNADEPPSCPKYHCRQPGLFQCRSAKNSFDCISPTQICDGVQQCSDNSDEENCEGHTCLESQFKCHVPPKCIARSRQCNGPSDCEDGADEKGCSHMTCAPNQFQCTNKGCIPYVWRCDSDDDCGDNSDEVECDTATCPTGHIKCKSGKCVPESWKCDGDPDCGSDDTSDEPALCQNITCDSTHFRCNSTKRCIPGRWRCDYDNDCRDGSDEEDCQPRNCTESEFRCDDQRCINRNLVCDGSFQCVDGSDEKNCTCTADQFQCSRFCIPKEWQCDGERDCEDAKDELSEHCKSTVEFCTSQEFRCSNGECIPKSFTCDGERDCLDGSDENEMKCPSHNCPAGYYRCPENKCISRESVCDGTKHCKNGEDEDPKLCGDTAPKFCTKSEFQCAKNYCIPLNYLCDGIPDCVNGTDEKPEICSVHKKCANDSDCKDDFMKCEKDTHVCQCWTGFRFSLTEGRCVDIDECKQFGHCSQMCVNKKGSHTCLCDEGFLLEDDYCVASGSKPYFLLALENELLTSAPSEDHFLLFKPKDNHTYKLEAIDVSIKERKAFMLNRGGHDISTFTIPISMNQAGSSRVKRMVTTPETVNVDGAVLMDPQSIAVDWMSKRLYWLDGGSETLEMASYNGEDHKVLIRENMHKPCDITLDLEVRRLFWSICGPSARIESANLDGSHRVTLVQNRMLWPSGIAVDSPNGRLYWADRKRKTIETVDLNGKDRQIIYTFGDGDDAPYKIDVFEDYIYVTTHARHNVVRIDKMARFRPHLKRRSYVVLAEGLSRIADIVILHPQKQKDFTDEQNPCSGITCSAGDICIVTPSGYNCTCTNKNCVSSPCDCLNNATCQVNGLGKVRCRCKAGFNGARCEHDVCYKKCATGKCVVHTMSGDDKATCNCTYKYDGERCDRYKCADYCKNGGFCEVTDEGQPKCYCQTGFEGNQCEVDKKDICSASTCKNGGTCHPGKDGNRPNCTCHRSYTGYLCKECVLYNGCQENCPVFTCSPHSKEKAYLNEEIYCHMVDQKPQCICPHNYNSETICSGNQCQGYCYPVNCPQCQNGGSCYADKKQQSMLVLLCDCAPGWTGPECNKVVVDCNKTNCKNDGNCQKGSNGHYCECALGYSGDWCGTRGACADNLCAMGSTCLEKDGIFSCKCGPGFQGMRCDVPTPKNTRQFSSSFVPVVVPIVLCILLIIVTVIIIIYKKRSSNNQFKHSRMNDTSNVEVTNPIYMKDYDDEEVERFPYDPEQNKTAENPNVQFGPDATNFTNPMYDTLYNDKTGLISPDEKKELLKEDDVKVHLYGDEDPYA